MRVALVQMEHGGDLDTNLRRAAAFVHEAADRGAQLVLLPEYFFATFPSGPSEQAEHAVAVRDMMREASAAHGIAVAGNVVERGGGLRNVGVVYDAGRLVLEQAKVHPMPREAQAGVEGGSSFVVREARGTPVGMLVCADVLYPEASRILALRGARLLLNPVMSPYREEPADEKQAREALYVARAYDAGAFVLKAGGFARGRIAGRSLVAAPWGLVARYKDDLAEEVLVADLDFARLDAFRERQRTFPVRRPEAYDGIV